MNVDRREILILCLCGALLLGVLYYFFILSPALKREADLRAYIERRQSDLSEMTALQAEWEGLKKNRKETEEALARRGARFTLLSFLEGISREAGISDKIQYMKPIAFSNDPGQLKQEGMEVSLEAVDVEQLARYLYKIEYSGKLLAIQRIKVQRETGREGAGLLKATLQVSTFAAES